MLHTLEWLEPGQVFPPLRERARIKRYLENEALFDGEHFATELRTRDNIYEREGNVAVYQKCAERISKVVGNFDDIISFPVLLNYQRLMSLKMADLVCGEYPSITGISESENEALQDVRDYCDFDEQLYATVLDISRFGDAIWRTYLDWSGRKTFTTWDPKEWFPIVSQDGTNTVLAHVLCWRVNLAKTAEEIPPIWKLHAQIHWCTNNTDFNAASKVGTYEERIYSLREDGRSIAKLDSSEIVDTGMDSCAVMHIKAYSTSTSVYGYDDYMVVDSILSEIMARIGQISVILDKHADPNITGPITMLQQNPTTGEYYLKHGKFFATSQGDLEPHYMTWDGQLTAAFSELEHLLNQLYILSEMGAALLGDRDGAATAISGTAMRFKMVNPLAKARRIANSMTLPVRRLFSELSSDADVDVSQSLELPITHKHIAVEWSDGLPDDPRENVEIAKLATGAVKLMPLKTAIMEYFGRTDEEAQRWLDMIAIETEQTMKAESETEIEDPNHPGPQDGTGVNPAKKGSTTGLNDFHSQTNTNRSTI